MLEVDIRKRLSGIELNVQFTASGTALALLGASGCGKSMTLKCIAGVERPDSGRIVLNGRVLFDSEKGICLRPQQRRVGMLFQEYALFPHMTALENVEAALGHLSRRRRTEAAMEQLRRMRLEDAAHTKPNHLSGGQRQRLALARMLALQPEALLLDEPFSALDSHLRWQVELELTEVLDGYRGDVVFVSHDRDEVCRLCRQVCVLQNGRSERQRTVQQLMASPDTVSAARLSGCKNICAATALDAHTLACPDWGLTLRTAEKVSQSVSAVGVRAHHIEPGQAQSNSMLCRVGRVMHSAFSTVVMLLPSSGAANPLRMELAPQAWEALDAPETLTVHIAPEHVIPLKGEVI